MPLIPVKLIEGAVAPEKKRQLIAEFESFFTPDSAPDNKQDLHRRGRSSLGGLRPHRRELFLAGLIAGSALALGYTAFSLDSVGYVTTLFKFSAIIAMIWGAVFLREPDLPKRFPASAVMAVGAILLTI